MQATMDELVELLSDLVRIESVNPGLQASGSGESRIGSFVADWFRREGFEVHWIEPTRGRPSVVGIARGTRGTSSLMFNGHIDTVGLFPFDGDPLQPLLRDDRMVGRGTYDMKSGVAAMMIAAKRAKKQNLSGDLIVACVSDEEHASMGTEDVLKQFRADAAIVTEPSQLELTVAHKGFAWFEVAVFGNAAHGSRPDLGVDAIAKMGRVLVALDDYQEQLRRVAPHPLLGNGSVHASLISGGQEWSSYPAECRLKLERRLLPHETIDQVEREIRGFLEKVRESDPQFRFELRRDLARLGMETSQDASILAIAAKVLARHTGGAAKFRGEAFWTDASLLSNAGIPTFLLGVKGEGAHSAHEWVDLSSMEILAATLTEIAVEFLQ
jgi:acetylornithine deacetylase